MFRFVLPPKYARELDDEQKRQFEDAFAEAEREVIRAMQKLGVPDAFLTAIQMLGVAGAVLMYVNHEDGVTRVHPLQQFCVQLDGEGTLLQGVVKECVSPEGLPADAPPPDKEDDDHVRKDVELYTHFYREGKKWHYYQEVHGKIIPSSKGHCGKRKCPWVYIVANRIDGEWYGRATVEEIYGSLHTVEVLTRSLTRSAAVAARQIYLVRRGSTTRIKDLIEAQEGGVVQGHKDDITMIEHGGKIYDFQFAKSLLDDAIRAISFHMLMTSAVQRDAERVTAEEFRLMVGELQDSQGALFTTVTRQGLLPLVELTLEYLRIKGEIPKLLQDIAEPLIITGVDALGRSHEARQLDEALARLQVVFGANAAMYLKTDAIAHRVFTTSDVDPKGLVKTPEEMQAEAEASQQQALAEKSVGPAIQAGAKMMTQPQEVAPQQ